MLGLSSMSGMGGLGVGRGDPTVPSLDMWGHEASNAVASSDSSASIGAAAASLGEDAPHGLLSGLESMLASPPRGQLPGMHSRAHGVRSAELEPSAEQSSVLASPPLMPRTLDFSSPRTRTGGAVEVCTATPHKDAPPGRVTFASGSASLMSVARCLQEWTRLARGGGTSTGKKLTPPLLCAGSDVAVALALAVAVDDCDAVVEMVLAQCGPGTDAQAAFGTPLDILAGHTPLTFLALHCELEGAAELLVGAYAQAINAPAAFGWTPLQCAALAAVLRATRGEPLTARGLKGVASLLAAGAPSSQLSLEALPVGTAKVLHL
jgi:hypothetical protein